MTLKRVLHAAIFSMITFAGTQAFATTYNIDGAHSSINFKIKHMLAKVNGRFTDWNGSFDFDPEMKKLGNFKANIKTASINTDNTKRDDHLRSPDFFDATKNPEISFVGKTAKKTGAKTFTVTGDLTMAGKTKPVTFDFEFLGEQKDPMGAVKAGFAGKTKLNRKDFNINWNKKLDQGGFVLGDDVEIEVLIEAEAQKAKSASL